MIRLMLALALVACGNDKKSDPAPVATSKPADVPAAPAKAVDPPAEVHDASCEAMRDKYLAWTADRVKQALGGGVAGAHTAELQAEADKEAARAKDKFVGACVAMGAALDASCLEIEHSMSRHSEKRKRFLEIVNEIAAK